MGMDVYGSNGTYFRASIWSWRAICHAMELAGYKVPFEWGVNYGAGLTRQCDCNDLSDKLDIFLTQWDGDRLVMESKTHVDETGRFVSVPRPGTRSAYWADREHIQEFIDFLRNCGGAFQIH